MTAAETAVETAEAMAQARKALEAAREAMGAARAAGKAREGLAEVATAAALWRATRKQARIWARAARMEAKTP